MAKKTATIQPETTAEPVTIEEIKKPNPKKKDKTAIKPVKKKAKKSVVKLKNEKIIPVAAISLSLSNPKPEPTKESTLKSFDFASNTAATEKPIANNVPSAKPEPLKPLQPPNKEKENEFGGLNFKLLRPLIGMTLGAGIAAATDFSNKKRILKFGIIGAIFGLLFGIEIEYKPFSTEKEKSYINIIQLLFLKLFPDEPKNPELKKDGKDGTDTIK